MITIKKNTNNYIVLDDDGAQIFTSTLFTEVYDYINNLLKDKNGTVLLRKAHYQCNIPSWSGPILQWGTDGFPNNRLQFIGEEGTKITGNGDFTSQLNRNFMNSKCNIKFKNIEFDLDTKCNDTFNSDYTGINIEFENCSFRNAGQFHIWSGINTNNVRIINNFFGPSGPNNGQDINGTGNEDQVCVSSSNVVFVDKNVFDKTTGNPYGSSLTGGGAKRFIATNNLIKRNPIDKYHGISSEGYTPSHDYIYIAGNRVENGTIAIGDTRVEAADTLWKSVRILNNDVINAPIVIHGSSDSSWINNKIDNVFISNNNIANSVDYGVYVFRVAGTVKINNNIITNSNFGEENTGTDYYRYSAICLEHTKNIAISNNIIELETSAQQKVNPCGLALYHDNYMTSFDSNTFINNKGSPLIIVSGNDNWLVGHGNRYKGASQVVYKNGQTGNSIVLEGGKTR